MIEILRHSFLQYLTIIFMALFDLSTKHIAGRKKNATAQIRADMMWQRLLPQSYYFTESHHLNKIFSQEQGLTD